MKKSKLSEIRVRDQSAPGGARFDVPYLLDLVERLGKALDKYCAHDATCNHRDIFEPRCDCGLEETRALLKELEL